MQFPKLAAVLLLGVVPYAAQAEPCKQATQDEIVAQFDRWNAMLKTGDADKVVSMYEDDAVLLPTLSNTPRLTREAKRDYFTQFLALQPEGRIDSQTVRIGCNTAVATGLYTFKFGNGTETEARYTYTYSWNGKDWRITSHHSSALPEK